MKQSLAFITFTTVVFAQHDLDQMVTGGEDESIFDSPFIVQATKFKSGIRTSCGGSIVSKFNVLSAAHCFYDDFEYIHVQVGSAIKHGGKPYLMAKYKIHPEYDNKAFVNDIIVITLHNPIQYSDKVKPIKLATSVPPLGSMVKVAGWGTLSKDLDYPSVLQSTTIPLVDIQLCKEKYPRVTNSICAGFLAGRSDCTGDSGGPLVWENTLLGIISYGDKCGLGPSGYTSIPALHDWIVPLVRWDEKI